MNLRFTIFLLGFSVFVAQKADAEGNPWKRLDDGLSIGVFDAFPKSSVGDSKITILRIDPRIYAFKLMSSSEHDNMKYTARGWCNTYGLQAAINAGMYQADGLTHLAYMRNYRHINNPRQGKDKCFIAFNPEDPKLPEVQIIDTQYQDFKTIGTKYNTLIQDIRAVSLHGENVWTDRPDKWSMALMGMDTDGNVLWIFTRSPYSVHDFLEILLALPIKLRNAAYLDGGPPASLYVAVGDFNMELFGSYETSVKENDDNAEAWRIPNVIGIVRRGK